MAIFSEKDVFQLNCALQCLSNVTPCTSRNPQVAASWINWQEKITEGDKGFIQSPYKFCLPFTRFL